jgi:hypothetical protein
MQPHKKTPLPKLIPLILGAFIVKRTTKEGGGHYLNILFYIFEKSQRDSPIFLK